VHFALTALERGHQVTMLDVGKERPSAVLPEATFDELKERLPDPAAYFLGAMSEGVVYPSSTDSYYGHPPSKQYVFDVPSGFAVHPGEMKPHFSFARGGLAEAWTAGTYAFNQSDLSEFPVAYDVMRRCYAEVAARIGIGGQRDDLERFIPLDGEYLSPLPLDPHSEHLWLAYQARRERLQNRLGFYLGRSRVATLSRPYRGREACDQLGRCLWGCPSQSIYSPAVTLRECLGHSGFHYEPGLLVRHFDYDPDGRVSRLVARRLADGGTVAFGGELFALAAGALPTSKIVLDSIFRRTGRIGVMPGLMDNRQVHVPFLTPAMIGTEMQTASYQFHHLAFGLERPSAQDYVHGQITTLKAASVHPIVQTLPTGVRDGLAIFRNLRAGLGVANVNLSDYRRENSFLTVRPIEGSEETELVIRYADGPEEPAEVKRAVRVVKGALRALGCFVPPGMTRILPKGFSVHYAGTMPMSVIPGAFTCSAEGRSHAFNNLYIVDGASFPFLPSKNLTFTLMANAIRVAEGIPGPGRSVQP
jgi:hypothetical protein